MPSAWPFFPAVKSALATAWRLVSRSNVFGTRLGIVSRLSIAFGAVAVLAVVAIGITEYGSSLIGAIEQALVVAPVTEEQAGPDVLPVELDRFQRAVLARVDSPDSARVMALEDATTALEGARAGYFGVVASALDESSLLTLDARMTAHRDLADQLVRSADARRRLLNEFNVEFESLDARVKASPGQAPKVFNDPTGHEYLVEANRILDDMRRQSAGFGILQGYGRNTVRNFVASEKTLAAILRDNERIIVQSFGDEWLATTRRQFKTLVWLRDLLVRTDWQRQTRIEDFSQNHAALSTLVRKATSQYEAARAFANARRQSTAALSAVSEEERRQRTLLIWLSACVLLLLLATTVNTVVSVVTPVRRLLQATRRIAQGEPGVIVPRGGIKELDILAVSFNQMAEQLTAAQAIARQYHGQLEAKVEERTRQLQHLAAHDPLTRLPNRRQLLTQLDATLRSAAEREHLVGLFFLDLDHFKNINDSMGHLFGDRVLQAISDRLRRTVEQFGFSARLGGDEFTVVYEHAARVAQIERAGQLLVRAFQEPLVVDGRELLMGISVGASVYPVHGRDPESLLRAADAALFHAKAQGRNQFRIFSPELLESAVSKFATEQGLRRAVERSEFELYFQPEFNLATSETGLVEALLRWRLPDGAHALPRDFLPVAEDCGLTPDIGDWVMRTTVEQAAAWHGSAWPDVRVAVNVSSLQLLDSRFVDKLQGLLRLHCLPPRCIEIELTENVLQTGHRTIEVLRQLRGIGVGIALDDFGTGYSSLVSLEQLPLSRVKLDRSLIASIDTSTRSQAITRAIIALCQSLGLEVTAEGVERREQLAWLIGHPAMYLQGYLLSRPVAGADLLPAMAAIPARLRSLLQHEPAVNADQLKEYRQARLRRQR